MSPTLDTNESGKSSLLILAIAGLVIAGAVFFAVFITSQRARTVDPRLNNLRLYIASPPPRDTIPPLTRPVREITPSPETGELPPETTPAPEATESGGTQAIPAPSAT